MDGIYIYESHLGWLYTSTYPLPYDDLYCETCGDSDHELGYCTSKTEAKKLLKAYGYNSKYIKEFLGREFPE